MTDRRYYSSRTNPRGLTEKDLYEKLCALYLLFRDDDYFKLLAGITKHDLPDKIKHKASINLDFQPFPLTKWKSEDIGENKIFDVIEFLHDHVAKPGTIVDMQTENGWNYQDYDRFDERAGREEFRKQANQFLSQYKEGYEISPTGQILRIGKDGISLIYDVGIIPFDEQHVDSRVKIAIQKWRTRSHDIKERKSAILELADVFEWLKKTQNLSKVLNRKDEAALFEIANQFALRHHEPRQKRDYDESIWYSWIFHFYLATYHAVIRMLTKNRAHKTIGSG